MCRKEKENERFITFTYDLYTLIYASRKVTYTTTYDPFSESETLTGSSDNEMLKYSRPLQNTPWEIGSEFEVTIVASIGLKTLSFFLDMSKIGERNERLCHR